MISVHAYFMAALFLSRSVIAAEIHQGFAFQRGHKAGCCKTSSSRDRRDGGTFLTLRILGVRGWMTGRGDWGVGMTGWGVWMTGWGDRVVGTTGCGDCGVGMVCG